MKTSIHLGVQYLFHWHFKVIIHFSFLALALRAIIHIIKKYFEIV